SGHLWVATTKEGVYRIDEATDVAHHYATSDVEGSLMSNAAFALIEDRDKQIWVGTFGGGLARWNPDSDSFVRYALPSDYIYAIREDPANKGVLWIGTADAGLLRLDTIAKTTKQFSKDIKNAASI